MIQGALSNPIKVSPRQDLVTSEAKVFLFEDDLSNLSSYHGFTHKEIATVCRVLSIHSPQ